MRMNSIHYSHILTSINLSYDNDSLVKPNVLLVHGESGSGKTFTIQTILNKLDLKHRIFDTKTFSEVGYQGNNIIDIFQNLNTTHYDEKFVIVLDEFDKCREKQSSQRDVSGMGIQESLLKILDGIEIDINQNTRFPKTINTKNFLFIFVGAFSFLNKSENIITSLASNGFCVESLNRINVFIHLNTMSKTDLLNFVARKNHHLIDEYIAYFRELGCNIGIDDYTGVVNSIVENINVESESYNLRIFERAIHNLFNDKIFNFIIKNNLKEIILDEFLSNQ